MRSNTRPSLIMKKEERKNQTPLLTHPQLARTVTASRDPGRTNSNSDEKQTQRWCMSIMSTSNSQHQTPSNDNRTSNRSRSQSHACTTDLSSVRGRVDLDKRDMPPTRGRMRPGSTTPICQLRPTGREVDRTRRRAIWTPLRRVRDLCLRLLGDLVGRRGVDRCLCGLGDQQDT
jgi:hypothetical protein